MITITRRLAIDAGHRVYGHESKCANLHGHRYTFLITVRGPKLDELGRVVDFSVVKKLFGQWIDEHWDHSFLFYVEDHILLDFFKKHPTMKSYLCDFNPTAENLAEFLLRDIGPRLLGATLLKLTKVKVYETENCSATAELDD